MELVGPGPNLPRCWSRHCGRGSSEIRRGKSIGLANAILLPAEAVESSRSRPNGALTGGPFPGLPVTNKVRESKKTDGQWINNTF